VTGETFFQLGKQWTTIKIGMVQMKIYTIGHSSNMKEEFLDMLKIAEIQYVSDVRAFPYSRKYPHFNGDQMKEWLGKEKIEYIHFPMLGGRRGTSGVVGSDLNSGWNNRSFHNYADYTLTEEFKEGIEVLKAQAKEKTTVYMCSERHPARCHRLIISNWLAANDWDVQHIITNSRDDHDVIGHELGKWGAVPIIEADGTVVYPKDI
jgi:uncharacterized protein (DUF488 family)